MTVRGAVDIHSVRTWGGNTRVVTLGIPGPQGPPGEDGGGPGGGDLADLDDVTLTDLATGEGIVWDGDEWVNVDLFTQAEFTAYTGALPDPLTEDEANALYWPLTTDLATQTELNAVASTILTVEQIQDMLANEFLVAGTNITLDYVDGSNQLTINATGGGGELSDLVDPDADRLVFWDDSAGAYAYLTLGTNLTITDTTLNAAGGGSSNADTLDGEDGAFYLDRANHTGTQLAATISDFDSAVLALVTGTSFADNIGDGSTTEIVVTHSLGTRDVQVTVYDNTTPFAELAVAVGHTTADTVTLVFNDAPTTDQFRVMVST